MSQDSRVDQDIQGVHPRRCIAGTALAAALGWSGLLALGVGGFPGSAWAGLALLAAGEFVLMWLVLDDLYPRALRWFRGGLKALAALTFWVAAAVMFYRMF